MSAATFDWQPPAGRRRYPQDAVAAAAAAVGGGPGPWPSGPSTAGFSGQARTAREQPGYVNASRVLTASWRAMRHLSRPHSHRSATPSSAAAHLAQLKRQLSMRRIFPYAIPALTLTSSRSTPGQPCALRPVAASLVDGNCHSNNGCSRLERSLDCPWLQLARRESSW